MSFSSFLKSFNAVLSEPYEHVQWPANQAAMYESFYTEKQSYLTGHIEKFASHSATAMDSSLPCR